MQRDQLAFRPDNKEVQHTCWAWIRQCSVNIFRTFQRGPGTSRRNVTPGAAWQIVRAKTSRRTQLTAVTTPWRERKRHGWACKRDRWCGSDVGSSSSSSSSKRGKTTVCSRTTQHRGWRRSTSADDRAR